MLVISIFPFPARFSTHPKDKLGFPVPLILSSANAFNLDHASILSFDKELKIFEKKDSPNIWRKVMLTKAYTFFLYIVHFFSSPLKDYFHHFSPIQFVDCKCFEFRQV